MTKRKHISLKTKLAATLLALGHISYDDAKNMSEDQIISLYNFDHNILHETGHPDRDKFWNLMPMLIPAHREKTKLDAKIIAKGRRLRAHDYWPSWMHMGDCDVCGHVQDHPLHKLPKLRKLQSRGFDKTLKRKMDGTVVKR